MRGIRVMTFMALLAGCASDKGQGAGQSAPNASDASGDTALAPQEDGAEGLAADATDDAAKPPRDTVGAGDAPSFEDVDTRTGPPPLAAPMLIWGGREELPYEVGIVGNGETFTTTCQQGDLMIGISLVEGPEASVPTRFKGWCAPLLATRDEAGHVVLSLGEGRLASTTPDTFSTGDSVACPPGTAIRGIRFDLGLGDPSAVIGMLQPVCASISVDANGAIVPGEPDQDLVKIGNGQNSNPVGKVPEWIVGIRGTLQEPKSGGPDVLSSFRLTTQGLRLEAECAPCDPGYACIAGECVCPAPRVLCDGVCVDLSSDADYCGTCEIACDPGEVCSGSVCGAPPCQAGSWTCQGDACACTGGNVEGMSCTPLGMDDSGWCSVRCPNAFQCTNPNGTAYAGSCTCTDGQGGCGMPPCSHVCEGGWDTFIKTTCNDGGQSCNPDAGPPAAGSCEQVCWCR